MINYVYKVGGEKHCRPITSREEYVALCNTPERGRTGTSTRSYK